MHSGSGCNHPRTAHPWRSLLPHLLALLLLRLGSAQSRGVAPRPHVTAIVGQDAVLRCHLSPCKDARSSDIRWILQRSGGLVHHYQNGVDLEQMEEYKGRTELLRHGLSDGNLDLRITAVTSSDSGSYICTVQDGDGYADAVVNLEVSDPFSPIIHSWAAGLAVVLTLLLGSFVIIVFLHRKRVTQRRELKRKGAQLAEQNARSERRDLKLEKQAAKLVEQTEAVEKWNSLLKKDCEETGLRVADLKKIAAKLKERTKELIGVIKAVAIRNSVWKTELEELALSAADLKILAAKLVEQTEAVEKDNSVFKEQAEEMCLRAANLNKLTVESLKRTKDVVVESEELDKQMEESD
ncbi:uncharacterized protein LOC110391557 isoform X3 [Numida meleagris]|uniref:uncharacterized protein LOC110391557 isoform X3 n=1 Tax=Numida meleagris TaxID=8996 RepID=UPI000B3DA018|nr:uncharacterized protein LOC110391557 isoform X3 [Numida meleagris]